MKVRSPSSCDHRKTFWVSPALISFKLVPTVWDDTRFLGGHPSTYVAIARRTGNAGISAC